MDSDAKELGMNVRPIDRLGLPTVKRSHTFLGCNGGNSHESAIDQASVENKYASGLRAIQNGGPRCPVWVESGPWHRDRRIGGWFSYELDCS